MENKAIVKGKVKSIRLSHTMNRYEFYEAIVESKRESGIVDEIKMVFKETYKNVIKVGQPVKVEGSIRTFTNQEGKQKLEVYVYVEDFLPTSEEEKDINSIILEAKICKPVNLRQTPKKRDICDIILVSNYRENRAAFIPTLAWGKDALECANYKVGDTLRVDGKLQSRVYQKRLENDVVENRTTYELSANTITKIN